MKQVLFFTFLLAFGLASCGQNLGSEEQGGHVESKEQVHGHGEHVNDHMNRSSFESMVANFESTERDQWQQPEKVLAFLGDLEGKKVMDIGSGTGYFSIRMLAAGADVISADVDDRFLEYIAARRDSLQIPVANWETRKIPYNSSSLQAGEVDKVVIVDTYHHIDNRPAYFAEVREGLKPGGTLYVIDFFKRELPVGPSLDHKISKEIVVKELQQAGYTYIELDTTLLPYQFLIKAGF